ncbi:unnamed protein product [Caenorhabditis sp. 36 PRJEB53466]|nr:unnamed protein product [Caenorhabditis sp. 36 PRJEB53466]
MDRQMMRVLRAGQNEMLREEMRNALGREDFDDLSHDGGVSSNLEEPLTSEEEQEDTDGPRIQDTGYDSCGEQFESDEEVVREVIAHIEDISDTESASGSIEDFVSSLGDLDERDDDFSDWTLDDFIGKYIDHKQADSGDDGDDEEKTNEEKDENE